jgi:hypothetical protein
MKAVLQWVLRTMMKDQTGIVRTMPKKDLVDFNVAMTAERLMRNGIDPNSLKNANQVENAINQIEAPRNVQKGIKSTKSAKVFDLKGKEIDPKKGIMGGKQIPDDDLPPPGSRGGKDDIAAPVQSEDEILEKLNRENKEARRNLQIKLSKDKGYQKFKGETEEEIRKRFGLDDPEDMAQGGRAGFSNGGIDVLKLEDEALQRAINAFKYYQRMGGKKNFRDYLKESGRFGDQFRAEGGRIGFKDGMTRRTFLKLLGGMAAVPIVGKFFKLAKVGKTMKEVPMIKTDDVAGKPEWFDALVNKVIREGDDVTKKFATGERQSIHQKTLDDGSVVRVTEDVDDGAVRVEYESEANVFGDDVQLQYKKPLPDEGDPRPAAEFTTAESGPVGRQVGPDDYDIDVDEVGGTSIRDLDSDVSKLKEYATGQKPTMKELVQNIERRKKAQRITTDPEAQSDAVIARQGEAFPDTPDDDFASGGIARMLGE